MSSVYPNCHGDPIPDQDERLNLVRTLVYDSYCLARATSHVTGNGSSRLFHVTARELVRALSSSLEESELEEVYGLAEALEKKLKKPKSVDSTTIKPSVEVPELIAQT